MSGNIWDGSGSVLQTGEAQVFTCEMLSSHNKLLPLPGVWDRRSGCGNLGVIFQACSGFTAACLPSFYGISQFVPPAAACRILKGYRKKTEGAHSNLQIP